MDWTIRQAEVRDVEAIAEVHVSAWQVAYRGLVPQRALDSLSVGFHRSEWLDALSRPTNREMRIWVATQVGQVLGFAVVSPCRDHDQNPVEVAELVAIYVRPNAWGHGAGRALVERAVAEAIGDGFAAMSLWVFEGNRRSRRFYHRLGFRPDGGRELLRIGGVDLPTVRYRLALTDATSASD